MQIQSATITNQLAHEDRKQANAATLPSASLFNQFIYTQGNGTPSGVFIANDGVHVYNEQVQAHEELLSLVRRGEVRLAAAAEAVSKARIGIAARGLRTTVVQDYYAIVSAERKLRNAQRSLDEARQFVDITQKQEKGGEAARADVIKAQIQQQQRERDTQDALLADQKAKIALAVLMFPTLQTDYSVVDDLGQIGLLPPEPEAVAQARASSPDLRATNLAFKQAKLGVTVARYAYLPSLGLDVFYGLDANQLDFRSSNAQDTGRSTLPHFVVPYRQNLGYSAMATLNVPLWNWGSTHSRVKQAQLRQQQAQLDVTNTQKQLQADIATAYQEAKTALAQLDSLRSSSDLSNESLRLTVLRYKAGEATTLEVVDAQTTANTARGAYDDGLIRYRVALENLKTLTGNQ